MLTHSHALARTRLPPRRCAAPRRRAACASAGERVAAAHPNGRGGAACGTSAGPRATAAPISQYQGVANNADALLHLAHVAVHPAIAWHQHPCLFRTHICPLPPVSPGAGTSSSCLFEAMRMVPRSQAELESQQTAERQRQKKGSSSSSGSRLGTSMGSRCSLADSRPESRITSQDARPSSGGSRQNSSVSVSSSLSNSLPARSPPGVARPGSARGSVRS